MLVAAKSVKKILYVYKTRYLQWSFLQKSLINGVELVPRPAGDVGALLCSETLLGSRCNWRVGHKPPYASHFAICFWHLICTKMAFGALDWKPKIRSHKRFSLFHIFSERHRPSAKSSLYKTQTSKFVKGIEGTSCGQFIDWPHTEDFFITLDIGFF